MYLDKSGMMGAIVAEDCEIDIGVAVVNVNRSSRFSTGGRSGAAVLGWALYLRRIGGQGGSAVSGTAGWDLSCGRVPASHRVAFQLGLIVLLTILCHTWDPRYALPVVLRSCCASS